MITLFFAGFFAKDLIDNIFFLIRNQYPVEVLGFSITAQMHKVMLVLSFLLTVWFLYHGVKLRGHKQAHND